MAEYLIQEEVLTTIANAIRNKTETTGLMSPTQMASAIAGIETNDKIADSIIDGTITSIENNTTKPVRNYAFRYCSSLTAASFPQTTKIGNYAFANCSSLTVTSFPQTTNIGNYAFCDCTALTTASFPNTITTGNYAFCRCTSLTTVSFPKASTVNPCAFDFCDSLRTASFPICTTIYSSAFRSCYNLISLYLMGSSVCTLSASNAFLSTPIGGYSAAAGTYGSIYVPASLYSSYIVSTNWVYFSSRFVSVSDGTEEGKSLIEFTVNGATFQAEAGMTWQEFVDSDYNTGEFSCDVEVFYNGNILFYLDVYDRAVEDVQSIIAGMNYYTTHND